MNEDGLPLGFDVPMEVASAVPMVRSGAIVALMSATCGPCREVAATMDSLSLPDPVVVLLTGAPEQRDVVASLLPEGVSIIDDPDAARLAGLLNIKSSPFAVRFSEGTVVAKAYLSESRTLERLYNSATDISETGLEVGERV
jgi:hypothetical protein